MKTKRTSEAVLVSGMVLVVLGMVGEAVAEKRGGDNKRTKVVSEHPLYGLTKEVASHLQKNKDHLQKRVGLLLEPKTGLNNTLLNEILSTVMKTKQFALKGEDSHYVREFPDFNVVAMPKELEGPGEQVQSEHQKKLEKLHGEYQKILNSVNDVLVEKMGQRNRKHPLLKGYEDAVIPDLGAMELDVDKLTRSLAWAYAARGDFQNNKDIQETLAQARIVSPTSGNGQASKVAE